MFSDIMGYPQGRVALHIGPEAQHTQDGSTGLVAHSGLALFLAFAHHSDQTGTHIDVGQAEGYKLCSPEASIKQREYDGVVASTHGCSAVALGQERLDLIYGEGRQHSPGQLWHGDLAHGRFVEVSLLHKPV
jgi:hypothetical protein